MKKKMIAGSFVAAVVITGFICVCIWFLSGVGSTYYYTQIDNSKIEQVESKKGKDITFGTSRELKEGAYIRLTVTPIRGVVEWEEVQYDELPADVQGHYEVPTQRVNNYGKKVEILINVL